MKSLIFALDDEPQWLRAVEDAVLGDDVAVETFGRYLDFAKEMRRATPDLLILDWNLGDITGLEVLRWVRDDLGSEVPVVLLTSRDTEEHIVAALEGGADDYVTKPVSRPVLRARIGAQLRRHAHGGKESKLEQFGPVAFDREARSVEREITVDPLSNREFELALLLFRNMGVPIARDTLYMKIWGNVPSVQSRTLDSHITALRRKLRLRPEYGYRLSTIYGYGYRLEEVSCED